MTSPYLQRPIRTLREASYQIAMAVGQDAGDKAARQAGRRKWSLTDHNAAVAAFETVYATNIAGCPKLWPEE